MLRLMLMRAAAPVASLIPTDHEDLAMRIQDNSGARLTHFFKCVAKAIALMAISSNGSASSIRTNGGVRLFSTIAAVLRLRRSRYGSASKCRKR